MEIVACHPSNLTKILQDAHFVKHSFSQSARQSISWSASQPVSLSAGELFDGELVYCSDSQLVSQS